QIYSGKARYPEAITVLRIAIEAEPYSATAAYQLSLALNRGGQREEGRKMSDRFLALREGGYGTVIGQNYPEQGQYAEAISSTGAEPGLVDPKTPDVVFTDATSSVLPAGVVKSPDAAPEVKPVFSRRFTAAEFN